MHSSVSQVYKDKVLYKVIMATLGVSVGIFEKEILPSQVGGTE